MANTRGEETHGSTVPSGLPLRALSLPSLSVEVLDFAVLGIRAGPLLAIQLPIVIECSTQRRNRVARSFFSASVPEELRLRPQSPATASEGDAAMDEPEGPCLVRLIGAPASMMPPIDPMGGISWSCREACGRWPA